MMLLSPSTARRAPLLRCTLLLLLLLLVAVVRWTDAFVAGPCVGAAFCRTSAALNARKQQWDEMQENIEEKSRMKASGGGAETAAGAILGTIMLGPFGA